MIQGKGHNGVYSNKDSFYGRRLALCCLALWPIATTYNQNQDLDFSNEHCSFSWLHLCLSITSSVFYLSAAPQPWALCPMVTPRGYVITLRG